MEKKDFFREARSARANTGFFTAQLPTKKVL